MMAEERYVAFLRGINVGGHHKVPMAELRKEMEGLNFRNVVTLLNSGNIVFDAKVDNTERLEKSVSLHLQKVFGFPVPTIIRKYDVIESMLNNSPFEGIALTKDIRLYVSFLQKDTESELQLPWTSEDNSYKILEKRGKSIFSVLDISRTNTPTAMEVVEKNFGKDVTTRNWNTILRIEKKIARSD